MSCAHGDDVGAGTKRLQKADDIGDVLIETEHTVFKAHIAGVVPVGDVGIMVGQKRAHGRAQQRREVARERRHHQHARLSDTDVFPTITDLIP